MVNAKTTPSKSVATKSSKKSTVTKSKPSSGSGKVRFFDLHNRTFVVAMVFILGFSAIGVYRIKQSEAALPNYHCRGTTLRQGSRSDCVRFMQSMLNYHW